MSEWADPADIFSAYREDLFGSDADSAETLSDFNRYSVGLEQPAAELLSEPLPFVHRVDSESSAGGDICQEEPSQSVLSKTLPNAHSNSKWQLPEPTYGFDVINWGLWQTSAHFWQFEGLYNFAAMTELWPGRCVRVWPQVHPSDALFDYIIMEYLKEHADSEQQTQVEFEGVLQHKQKGSPPPATSITAVHTVVATATTVAATLAVVPPAKPPGATRVFAL